MRARLQSSFGVSASRGWLGAAILAGILASGVAAGEIPSAEKLVDDTLQRALVILNDESLSEDEKLHRIEAIVFDHFDFDTMSRLVLARNWKRFSDEQQVEFTEEYKRMLSRTYGDRLDRFGDEKVEVLGQRDETRGDVTVFTRIIGGKYDDARINYRMRNSGDRWRAIDVVIEGVSLVSTYRSQFGDIMSKRGPAALIEEMKTKNLAAPSLEPREETE